jgi:hypothetical protein
MPQPGCGGGDRPGTTWDVRVRAAYRFPGRQDVDATLKVEALLDPARDMPVAVPVPRGQRLVQVVIGWRNAGPDPLPWDVLRFALVDDGGRRIAERVRVPPQRIHLAESGTRLVARVAFALKGDAHPAALEMGSIVPGSPLQGRWDLKLWPRG